jgi:Fe2+ or Zn2+ uptake regulation protein
MTNQVNSIIKTLKDSGRRQTKLKKAILQIMSEEKRPLTVIQILDLLKRKNINPNKSSIYRFLQTMQEEKLLRIEALNPGEAHFELAIGQTHNHFTCLQCSKIICLDAVPGVKDISNQITSMYGVQVENEKVNITGTCAECLLKNQEQGVKKNTPSLVNRK